MLEICCRKLPQDKIYAFCGWMDNSGPAKIGISIDYGIDLRSCFIDVAVNIINHDCSLDILSVPTSSIAGHARCPGLPSWVPDRGSPYWLPSLAELGSDDSLQCPYQAAGGSSFTCEPKFEQDHTVLIVHGYILTEIARTGALMTPTRLVSTISDLIAAIRAYSNQRRIFREWETMIRARIDAVYMGKEPILDAYWQTLIIGRIKKDELWGDIRRMFQQVDRFTRPPLLHYKLHLWFIYWLITLILFLLTFFVPRQHLGHLENRRRPIAEKKLIKLTDGHIGPAACFVQQADFIALFQGARVRWLSGKMATHGA